MVEFARPMLLLAFWMVTGPMTRGIAAISLGAMMQPQQGMPQQGADPAQFSRVQRFGLGTVQAVAADQGRRRLAQIPGAGFLGPTAGQECPPCAEALAACAQDDGCIGYLMCALGRGCGVSDPCSSCLYAAAGNAAVLAFNSCIQQNGCLGGRVSCNPCVPPQRSQAQMRAQVALNTLRGTYDIVYGLSPEYDCPPYQQYRFSTKPSVKPGKAFQLEFIVKSNYTQDGYMRLMMNFGAMDAATGSWPTTYNIAGFAQNQTTYVLDSVKDGNYWHVLLVYCGDFINGCFSGGIVLSKKLPGSGSAQLPASVAARFAHTLAETGWAERHDAGWEKWCKVPLM